MFRKVKLVFLVFFILSCFSINSAYVREPQIESAYYEYKRREDSGIRACLLKYLDGAKLTGAWSYDSGIYMFPLKSPEDFYDSQISYGFRDILINGKLYFVRIENLYHLNNKEELANLKLLFYTQNPNLEKIKQCISEGGSMSARDQACYGVIFEFQKNNQRVELAQIHFPHLGSEYVILRRANEVFIGEDNSYITPYEYLERLCAYDLLDEVINNSSEYKKNKKFDNIRDDIKHSHEVVKLTKGNILKLQKDFIIPAGKIEGQEIPKGMVEWGDLEICSSCNDRLIVKVFISENKDRFMIIADSRNGYKEEFLDLDSLATLYAKLISKKHGKCGDHMLDQFSKWKKYIVFKNMVLNYILSAIQEQSYFLPSNINTQNLVKFNQKMLAEMDSTGKIEDTRYHFVVFIYLAEMGKLDEEIKSDYEKLFSQFMESPKGLELLKKLAEDKNYKLSSRSLIKAAIRRIIMKNYLIKMLMHSGYSFPKVAVKEIVKYWEPDQRFIEKLML